MFNTITTKTKILVPMFFLSAILIFIGAVVVFINYTKITSFESLNEKIVFTSNVSKVLHNLQKERGLSCGYVVNQNDKFRNEMLDQRAKSNIEIKKLKERLKTISSKDFQKETNRVLVRLSQLSSVRKEIDQYNITYNGVIKYYSNINSSLLDIFVNISQHSHIPEITKNILSYSYFLYFKEYMGIERAVGVTIYSKRKLERESLLKFSNILSLENRSEKMFLKYASKDLSEVYKKEINRKSMREIFELRKIILYKNITESKVDSTEWFEAVTTRLNKLDVVASYIEKEIIRSIEKELHSLNSIFIMLSSLIFISLLVFVLMLIAFFKLAREEQRLRIVMDKYIISSTTDLKGRIIDVSEAFCKISGYTKKELIGKSHNILRHSDMPKETFRKMWYRLSRGLSWSGKVKNKTKDGGFYWVYANVEPLFTSGGNVESYISIRLDITESELLISKISEEEQKNKLQEEMIREQSRLAQMGEMISMIAHQWRQPLSAIAAASGSLKLKAKRNTLDQETAIKISDKIKNFSLHLSSTIDDFRNFFKTNKKETLTNFELILEGVLSIIEASLEENNILLNIKIEEVENFNAFENELKQVILNLIKNAEDALMDNKIDKPQINIYIEKSSFTVLDNAGGISPDIIGKIFDPYFSTKTKKDGTGLGLYMSKMIVEDHCKGIMQVSNEMYGAKFKINLGEHND